MVTVAYYVDSQVGCFPLINYASIIIIVVLSKVNIDIDKRMGVCVLGYVLIPHGSSIQHGITSRDGLRTLTRL